MNSQNDSVRSKTKITNVASLRAVVAAYLFYLGFTILRDVLKGEPGSLPVWLLWLCGILFMLAAPALTTRGLPHSPDARYAPCRGSARPSGVPPYPPCL